MQLVQLRSRGPGRNLQHPVSHQCSKHPGHVCGRVDPSFVLEALKRGADGVLVAGCRLGECHYQKGNYQALQRVNVLRGVLEKIGINPERVKIIWCAASEGEIFARQLKEFVDELKAMGPVGTELKGKEAPQE